MPRSRPPYSPALVFDELPDAAGTLAAMRHRERFPHERR